MGVKRKTSDGNDNDDGDYNQAGASKPVKPKAKRAKRGKAAVAEGSEAQPPEKRLARIRTSCPKNIQERAQRVYAQRFFLVDRQRNGDELREVFKVLGSTGNVYEVVLDKLPSCSCPDAMKGNHCKHILFVFLKVLSIPSTNQIWYQKALLTCELQTIFDIAKPNPTVIASQDIRDAYGVATGSKSKLKTPEKSQAKHKKPDDDCAICYEAMEGEEAQLEAILVWCDTCDKAIHKECFGQWSNTAKGKGDKVTCVYCRAPWPIGSIPSLSTSAGPSTSAGGYLNLTGGVRDTSSYYHGPQRGVRMYDLDEFYSSRYRDY